MKISPSLIHAFYKINSYAGCLLFFMMLFLPNIDGGFKLTKLILMALLVLTALLSYIVTRYIGLHPTVLFWSMLMILNSLSFITIGVFYGTPGAISVITVFVVWPLVYTIYISAIASEINVIVMLMRVLNIATIAIGIYGILFILNSAGIIPNNLFFNPYPPLEQRVGFHEGYIRTSIRALPTLLFSVPFTIAALFTWSGKDNMPVSRKSLSVALILGAAMVLLSARKALIIVVLLAPLITLLFSTFLRGRQIRFNVRTSAISSLIVFGVLIGTSIYLQHTYDFNFTALYDFILTGFDFQDNAEAITRKEQFGALLNGWFESPLLGGGHGASALGSIRDAEAPWSYELYFLALLFQTGLIGFSIYVLGLLWIFCMGIKIMRSNSKLKTYMLPVLVGTSCFLIGSATNPYLDKYDYLWVIFFPIAVINCWLLEQKRIQIIAH